MIAATLQTISVPKKESVLVVTAKIMLNLVFGTLCFSKYPVAVNVVALSAVCLILLNSLIRRDHFSFFLQLLFGNHVSFGSDNGGLYNLAGLLALIAYYLLYERSALRESSLFGNIGKILFAVLIGSEAVALIANERIGIAVKVSSFGIFALMMGIVYCLSKIKVVYEDYVRFIYVLLFYTFYMLIVSINQRIFFTDLAIFPSGDPNAEFELGIVRSGGAMLNYEAYAEYSLSMIVLLVPGILTGRIKQASNKLFLASLAIIVMSLYAIVLSGTRSSLALLPIAILFILFSLGRRIRIGYLFAFFGLAIAAFLLNMKFEFVDVSVFAERSASMDLEHMSLKDLLSGSEMNRGDIFEYGFKKLNETKGIIGAGYYTKEENYVVAHFDRLNYLPTDYHNLYLSSFVLWGVLGALSLLLFFFIALFQGMAVYYRKRHKNDLSLDLLLGFNTFFLFFVINEYKIQFIRFSNYFVLMLLFLILYRSLIMNVKTDFEGVASDLR